MIRIRVDYVRQEEKDKLLEAISRGFKVSKVVNSLRGIKTLKGGYTLKWMYYKNKSPFPEEQTIT